MNQQGNIICPLCGDEVEKLLYRYHLDNERQVIERIKNHNPDWTKDDGACGRCVDYYHTEIVMEQRMLPEVGPYFPVKSADDFIILPTPLRLDADARYTGKGVTICFIDSGFYIHPDLTMYKNRIKNIVDITNPKQSQEYFSIPHPEAWHGTMTSVVCAGDGYLSNGLYKGVACDSELVLLKVQNDAGRITTENISKALEWVLSNHKKYNIRIVNMSLGDDEPVSYKQSEIDKLAEQLIEKGITIVAAAGNDENGTIKPPANSLSVIAVGGINDNNNLNEDNQLYHSSYGKTIDGLMKPELIAPAIWIAAPILPGTKEQAEAETLHSLLNMQEDKLQEKIPVAAKKIQIDDSIIKSNNVPFIREAIINRIQSSKYISPHYMHVDGTSFAAPIVSSVIAQLLEANPELTPSAIREVLFSTAKRINGYSAERQGFGSVHPKKSLLKVFKREVIMKTHSSPYINRRQKTIEFYVQHDCASQISLAGSFNHWAQDVLLMEPGKKGLWKIKIPMLPAGKYQYKFFVDDRKWLEDVDNPYREPDGFHGFNSILLIEN
jgi:serine protease AprX